jgi:alginate O-acetyltransferase complex protein AlgI
LKPVKKAEYVLASLKVLTGIGFAVAATSMTSSPVLAAWMLWVGLGFILYFGLFHIHALFLQSQGRSVVPIMKAPLLSCSVSEFWGKRWNLAFRDYAHRTLFKPMSKRLGPQLATMIGFFFSGVIHEIAISIPAGGGYGFPMLYFLLQGVALIAERKFKSLKAGWRGRLWTIACVLIPAPLLFHSEFMTSVVFPIIKFLASIMGQ